MLDQALRSRDELLCELRDLERDVAAARAAQVRVLRDLIRRRELPGRAELAAVLDVSPATAKDLLETANRTPELSDRMEKLQSGAWSFDRAAAVAPLVRLGADEETMATAEARDITGVKRLAALQRRITRRSEREAFEERHVRAWPSLDEAAGFLSVQVSGPDWQTVTTALDRRGDALPRDPESTAEQRRADALVALANDYLDGRLSPSHHGTGNVVTIMVDPATLSATGGEAGATVTAGPRVGPEAIEEMLCTGAVEILMSATAGTPISIGPTTNVIPPRIRRLVLTRDGACSIDGCGSTYRLEVHHIVPRSRGGTHHPSNLVTLCWFHHHVEVHGRHKSIDPSAPPHRRRLVPRGRGP